MKALLCTTAALVVALVAVPAHADVAPQATDVCGDGGTAVTHAGERVEVERAAQGQDLRSATVRVVRPLDGEPVLVAVLGTCGPASEAADHDVSWEYDDGCTLHLRRARPVVGPSTRSVLEQYCPTASPAAYPEPGVDLPGTAFSVAGDTAVFRVPLSLVPAEVLPRLAPGATWTRTRATVSAPPTTVTSYGFGLTVGNRDGSTDTTFRADELEGGGGTVEQPQS